MCFTRLERINRTIPFQISNYNCFFFQFAPFNLATKATKCETEAYIEEVQSYMK